MQFLRFLIHIVALSVLTMATANASSDQKTTIDFQAMQQHFVQVAQQMAVDMGKPLGNKPSEQEKSLPAIEPEKKVAEVKKPTSYHQRSNSYATNPDSDPPRYVRQLSDIGVEAFKDITWLDIGLEHRTRYEWRNNDIRRIEGGEDNPFFLRNRAWIGIKNILDPFRFAVEFQDSRVYNNKHAITDQERNEFDLLNAYGELNFKKALGVDDRGNDRPIRFRVGRMAYEATDRRFIARNEWRNTTNTFEGFRLNLGKEANDWELDLFGMQPVRRLQTKFDEANDHLWFFGAIGTLRRWSDIATLQAYYMGQKQTADPNGFTATNRLDRQIHMPGFRIYGKAAHYFDFDVSYNHQLGFSGTNRVDAHGYTIELGKTFDHAWKPRVNLFYGYASGDKNPTDNVDNRFDRFFGFARPWSADHYVIYENLKAPKIRFEFQPTQKLGFEMGYGGYWLASKTDRMFDILDGNISNTIKDPGFNRDRTGQSGDFGGHSFEGRIRYQPTPRINTILGYTHFTAGEFVKNRIAAAPHCDTSGVHPCVDQRSGNTDFLYFEVLISLL
ncbi:alginate export family protein [Nitrosomonas sp. JL21]|uniref:alginate export family protein n=1 Tax=Nitrosomonas sp. JL21 TaxID=153949 RepID=UPI00136E2BB2|nr:alginate export family protein [Nitrosomonas sp.]MXS77217.1 alginate export family protein [Nitrosomonas sp. JL21]